MRRYLFWTHFVMGLAAGLFVLIMSATGVLLTFESQMLAWARNAAIEVPEDARPLSIQALAGIAREAGAGSGSQLIVPQDRSDAVELRLGRRDRRFLDPFAGEPIGEIWLEGVFQRITAIHRWLAFQGGRNEVGAALNAAANLLFAGLLITGAILWLPRRWRGPALRTRLYPRKGLPNTQARHFNWHHAFALWSFVPLLAIVLSGVLISYPWASRSFYALFDDTAPGVVPAAPQGMAPAGASGPLTLDALASLATNGSDDWNRLTITLPAEDAAFVAIDVDRGNGVQSSFIQELEVSLDGGTVLDVTEVSTANPATAARRFMRFLHTGEVYGLPGQAVAGLASLFAVVLVYTGVSLAIRRLARMARAPRPVTN